MRASFGGEFRRPVPNSSAPTETSSAVVRRPREAGGHPGGGTGRNQTDFPIDAPGLDELSGLSCPARVRQLLPRGFTDRRANAIAPSEALANPLVSLSTTKASGIRQRTPVSRRRPVDATTDSRRRRPDVEPEGLARAGAAAATLQPVVGASSGTSALLGFLRRFARRFRTGRRHRVGVPGGRNLSGLRRLPDHGDTAGRILPDGFAGQRRGPKGRRGSGAAGDDRQAVCRRNA